MDLQVLSLTEKSGMEIDIPGLFSTWVAFKAVRLEVAKEACITREDGKVWVLSSGLYR